jgi:hypothetical protein
MLVVMLWPPHSEITFYRYSWRHDLYAVGCDNLLWRVPFAFARKAGCDTPAHVVLDKGGFTIHDARTIFLHTKRIPPAAVYTSPDMFTRWKIERKRVSATKDMHDKLKASETERFKLHIEIEIIPNT